jgi:hypothetical protein
LDIRDVVVELMLIESLVRLAGIVAGKYIPSSAAAVKHGSSNVSDGTGKRGIGVVTGLET